MNQSSTRVFAEIRILAAEQFSLFPLIVLISRVVCLYEERASTHENSDEMNIFILHEWLIFELAGVQASKAHYVSSSTTFETFIPSRFGNFRE